MHRIARRDLLAAACAVPGWRVRAPNVGDAPAPPEDEAFWSAVRARYRLPAGQLNLGSAARGPARQRTLARVAAEALRLNASRAPAVPDDEVLERVRGRLRRLLNAPADSLALVRNTTEGVTTVLLNWPLAPGDEIVCTHAEHAPFYDTLAWRAARDGLTVTRARLPMPAPTMDAIADAVEAACSPRTRLVLVPHVVLYGQELPIRAIADRVHARGAYLLVDGVLAVGHVPVDLISQHCDFYAAGLHKWVGGPRGTGVLFVRPALQERLPPLFGAVDAPDGRLPRPMHADATMRKYESFGGHPEAHQLVLDDVLAEWEALGATRIASRLRLLTRRWSDRASRLPGFRLAALPDQPGHVTGLLGWEWPSRDAPAFWDALRRAGVMLTGTESYAGVFGIPADRPRSLVATNVGVFTSAAEVDRFAALLESWE